MGVVSLEGSMRAAGTLEMGTQRRGGGGGAEGAAVPPEMGDGRWKMGGAA
jgi:hypothetical protein